MNSLSTTCSLLASTPVCSLNKLARLEPLEFLITSEIKYMHKLNIIVIRMFSSFKFGIELKLSSVLSSTFEYDDN